MVLKRYLVLAALFCSCTSGSNRVRYMKDISQVSYISQSGTLSPELQWYETIDVTTDKVTLHRNGRAKDTEINEGDWEFATDEAKVAAFFEQLEAIDCSSIEQVEPDEPTEGGGTETYRVVYARGKSFSVWYGQGTTFTDGRLMTDPIDAFIESLELPAEAASRYR